MCHQIFWYHALCLHTDHAFTVHICCEAALHCNYDCGNLESLSLPMVGACSSCVLEATSAMNRSLKSLSLRKQPYAIPPIMESLEDDARVETDDTYYSGEQSKDSTDDLELFDSITL
ncbi:hypothetical protein BJX61DRAFT_19748 [Aspergillus egyptiacus]|nr:hypothetical protein BJX61DRAFT_19748 [Aspergillus egyptiacus]